MHFGVELHGIEAAVEVGSDRKGRIGGCAVDGETGRDPAYMIAVAHPDLFALLEEPALEQVDPVLGRLDVGAAEFGGAVAALDVAAQHLHHDLLAVADAQHRHAQLEDYCWRAGRSVVDDRSRTTGQDHRLRGEVVQEGIRHQVERMDFAIDVQFTQAPRDQLRHLGAEVDDEEAVVLGLNHML